MVAVLVAVEGRALVKASETHRDARGGRGRREYEGIRLGARLLGLLVVGQNVTQKRKDSEICLAFEGEKAQSVVRSFQGRDNQMIISSVRARIVKDTPGALEWAHGIAALVKRKTGNEVEVLVRIGATQDVVWLQRFQDLAAYEKATEGIQADPEYQAQVKGVQDKGYFDGLTVEAGIWRQL